MNELPEVEAEIKRILEACDISEPSLFVIYQGLPEWPDDWVMKRHPLPVGASPWPTPVLVAFGSLTALRMIVPRGLERFPLASVRYPTALECWV